MLPAHEHPDTAEATFDVTLGRIAIASVILTIFAPAAAAMIRTAGL